jgi:hypothetical protein
MPPAGSLGWKERVSWLLVQLVPEPVVVGVVVAGELVLVGGDTTVVVVPGDRCVVVVELSGVAEGPPQAASTIAPAKQTAATPRECLVRASRSMTVSYPLPVATTRCHQPRVQIG